MSHDLCSCEGHDTGYTVKLHNPPKKAKKNSRFPTIHSYEPAETHSVDTHQKAIALMAAHLDRHAGKSESALGKESKLEKTAAAGYRKLQSVADDAQHDRSGDDDVEHMPRNKGSGDSNSK